MTATPAPVPQYSPREETDLLWYFGPGQAVFERSTMGSMLERAEAFGSVTHAWPMEPVLTAAGVCIGHRSAITARPTAETHEVSGYVPDDQVLTRYAHVSKIMLLVERRSALAATVLALYFGEAGNRWALGTTGHGRVGALYHLTEKGRALVAAASTEPNTIQIPAPQRLEVLAAVNKAKATEERSMALAKCCRQAEHLEREARAAWHDAKKQLG
jgi:hypothetical protein